ncbi:Parp14, partial [Symbiodinium sp. KB8]
DFPITPSTLSASLGLALRCLHEEHGNPSNEAYLLHGSNPTSALSILRTSFKMGLAGRNAGSMFGPGVYLAESSVKADEYAQDDTNGSYAGLYAVLFCRAVVGRALQVTDPADYGPLVTSGDFESVVGDRERAVGTFREFVFFHEEAIYPEFAVFYRREL